MSLADRPSVAPEVLADLTAAVPARVSKRLDANPRAADAFTWSLAESITILAGEETVTLRREGVRTQKDASCTCLLQPRCFHLLAVLAVLPLAAAPEGEIPERPTPSAEPISLLGTAERETASEALTIGARILCDGLSHASTLRMGELVRVVHRCRRDGLFRLESAALAVFEAARDLREKSPDFRLAEAATRLAELVLVAGKLVDGATDARWLGIGRRAYTDAGPLRLSGIACAPVVRKGYSGVVTYLTDGARIYTAQDVLPGDDERAVHAWEAQLRFGETSLSHREASREGLLFANAQLSQDGRLGAGKSVVCVSAKHDSSLVARLFDEPFGLQLERADRGERHGLLFVTGVVDDGALVLEGSSAGALPLTLPIDDLRFAYRENLDRLDRSGARVRLVARLAEDGAALDPIAADLGEGHFFSLAYDRIARRHLPVEPAPIEPRTRRVPNGAALEPMRRRVLRFALAGAPSLPTAALPELARERETLRGWLMPTGANVLEALATSAHREPLAAARAWLSLHTYLLAAERALARSTWGIESFLT
jgi:hypothetical protein